MNSQIRKLAIIAFAAALPLGLAAQSGSTGSSTSGTSGSSSDTTRSGASTSGSSSRDQSSSTRGTSGSSTGSSMSSPSSTTGSSTGSSGAGYSSSTSDTSSSGMHGIAKVDQNSIKQQLTATDLIGKDVYDNGGKKVGEVKDLVLGSAAASHLAMAFANSSGSDDATSSSRSTTGATGASGTGSTSRIAGTDRTSGTGSTSGTSRTSGSMGSTLSSDVSSAFNSMSGMASEPAAIVSLGGFMGMGDNLVRVPLSQLNYDSSKERLTLALSENELSSLTDRSNTRNAAE